MKYKITIELIVEDSECLKNAIAEAECFISEANGCFTEPYATRILKAWEVDD